MGQVHPTRSFVSTGGDRFLESTRVHEQARFSELGCSRERKANANYANGCDWAGPLVQPERSSHVELLERRALPNLSSRWWVWRCAWRYEAVQSAGQLPFTQDAALECANEYASYRFDLCIVDQVCSKTRPRRELVSYVFTHRRAPFGDRINHPGVRRSIRLNFRRIAHWIRSTPTLRVGRT
jgi:hypothetical protein